MVGRRLLLTSLVLVSVLSASDASASSQMKYCSGSSVITGECQIGGALTDDAAVLDGSQTGSGGGKGGANGSGSGGSGGGAGSGNASGQPEPGIPVPVCAPGDGLCIDRQQFTVTSLVPTLNDIAEFRPTSNVDHMEPNGWFVVGLDANFYATGGQSVVDGTLLGLPASVRFTPIRWTWEYGDGASTTSASRGGSWAALGVPEFGATAASHVYTRPGTYFIDLTVGYRAEYQFAGGGWGTIAGTLWLPSNRLVATVGGAKTVLVERDCTLSPPGPGC